MNHTPIPSLTIKQWKNFVAKIKAGAGCWEWTAGLDESGYGKFGVGGKIYKASRVMWRMNRNEDPGELLVLHRCDNRKCCRPDHLFLGTYQDNKDDCIHKVRAGHGVLKGSKNGRAKLTEEEARTIKCSNEANIVLAQRFSISDVQVRHIKNNKLWKHVA